MERADEPAAFAMAPVVDELRAAMPARIEVRLDRVGVDAHHDDRLVEVPVLHEIARVGDLFEPARHLPHVRPEVLALRLEELGRVVPGGGDTFRVGDWRGDAQDESWRNSQSADEVDRQRAGRVHDERVHFEIDEGVPVAIAQA